MKKLIFVLLASLTFVVSVGFTLTTWKMLEFRESKNLFIEHEKWELACNHDEHEIILFGDSQFALMPAAMMGTLPVCNQGICGSWATKSLERFIAAMDKKPRAVVIEIGTNDIGNNVEVDKIANSIEAMVAYANKEGITPIVCTILPVSGEYLSNHPLKEIEELNRKLKNFDSDVIDLNSKLTAKWENLTKDGLHPNFSGYVVISKEIIKSISPILYATYLKSFQR